jgi:antitoxin HicB
MKNRGAEGIMARKDLNYYLSLPYTIELIPDEEGYWFARIPLLEGCMTNAGSRENALIMLDDAKQLWLETALALGKTIPESEAIPHE